jgi:hypothetical protein
MGCNYITVVTRNRKAFMAKNGCTFLRYLELFILSHHLAAIILQLY